MLVIVYLGQNKRDNHQIVAFLGQSFLILLKNQRDFSSLKEKQVYDLTFIDQNIIIRTISKKEMT